MYAYLGIACLLGVAILSIQVVGHRHRHLRVVLFGALFFRVLLVVVDHLGLLVLPGSGADGAVFMNRALAWAELPWTNLLPLFDPTQAHAYSWIGAALMKILGAHPLVFRSLNLVAGIWVVILVALLAEQLWGKRAAKVSASIAAFYPFAAFNSAVTLREEFSILFFLVGLYFFIKWARVGAGAGIVIAFLGFWLATVMHPGWSSAFIGVGAYAASIFLRVIGQFIRSKRAKRRDLRAAGSNLIVIAVAVVSVVLSGGVELGKGISVGTQDADLSELIEARFERDPAGGSAYPAFVATGDPYSQPWLIPSRIIYFVFSPFPWDIRSPIHLIGFLSSGLYLLLCWHIYNSFPKLRERPECVAMLFMLFALVFVFAIGTTNIGTAIRHRTKLLVLFVLLAGPELGRRGLWPWTRGTRITAHYAPAQRGP